MKKTELIICALTAMAFSIAVLPSCNKNEDKPEEEQKEEQKEEEPWKPGAGEYTFVASPLKGRWEAGDKIYIHGAYGPAAQTVTLSASDIAKDGGTATVQLSGDLFEYPLQPDYYYAAWPADAVVPNDGIMRVPSEFQNFDGLLTVAYLQDSTVFSFADASSCLKFKVSDYTDFSFSGNLRPGLRFSLYEPEYSSKTKEFFDRSTDGYPFIEGKIKDGEVTMWLPGTITFKKGYTIFFGKDGQWPAKYSFSEDYRFTAGEVLDLGDISDKLEAYSGPAPKIPEMGQRNRYSLNVNELSGLCMSASNDFIWGVGDGGDLVKISFEPEILSNVHISGDTEAITIDPATGNLIIGGEPAYVWECEGPDFKKKSELFKVNDARGYGNAGMEGITYYKDGLIYCGMQTGSELYCIVLETGEVVWKKNLRQTFSSITEIADLCYDPLTDWLWIVDSESKKFFALTGDAESMLATYSIKHPANPESICVDHVNSCIWIGDDYGDVSFLYRYDFTGLDDAIIIQ